MRRRGGRGGRRLPSPSTRPTTRRALPGEDRSRWWFPPTVCNVKLGRVLIDGGAALNILSPAAFDAIKALGMVLRPSQPIIGVTPGHTWPLGHIDLPVTFGGPANFRTERVNFDVADLSP